MIRLSDRLQMVADMVSVRGSVADIGCDHGYTSMYLVQSAGVGHVIAMDINRGPLEKAREHIMREKMDEYIETRLSDGAKELAPGEVEGMVISGMGGALTVRILSESRDVTAAVKELVLQPQSEPALVRKYLHESGFAIAEERMTVDADKFYVAMRAVPGREDYGDGERAGIYYHYGKCLVEGRDQVLQKFLHREAERLQKIMDGLRQEEPQGASCSGRLRELSEQRQQIYAALTLTER